MSFGLRDATYGAPMSGKEARFVANGGKDSRNGRGRGKSQARRGKSRGGSDSKAPGRGGAAAGWGRWS